MNHTTEQIIQTSQFLDDKVKVTCVCCEQESFDNNGYCGRCQAPLDLSRTAEKRGVPVNFVSVLGASGAGKTVFIGMLLDILSKGGRGIQGLPNNAFSVAIQQQTIGALENRRFPEKTASEAEGWQWVHCEVSNDKKRRNYLDVITPDFAGEAIATELEHPGTYVAIREVIRRSRAVLMLIDSMSVRDSGRDEDFFAMKLSSYIHNLRSPSVSGRKQKPVKFPLGIVLTKSDECREAMVNPEQFASDNMPGFGKFLSRNFSSYKFFASSVVGSSATYADHRGYFMPVPLHVEPRGITEPLEWIINCT
ncbi:MAG: YcjX family protein [Planctomycetaceae bacterium]|nr:YcjX family protein [Planctomycetaceae bacterium]